MSKWIITDHAHPSIVEGLQELGKEVDWLPGIGHAELLSMIHQYEGMIISSKTAVQKELIDRAERLKIVGRLGSGMEHVDTAYCATRDITCLSSPEGNANAVAEHAFGMLLALMNNIRTSHNELLEGTWERERNRGVELRGKTLGIIGFGNTGSAFAGKFEGWQVKILAYDKYRSGFGAGYVEEVAYDTLLAGSDIISFHIPLNDETRHWIDRDFIRSCRPGVILINTSRGAIADTLALQYGLEEGIIGGICLDVYEDEPINTEQVHSKAVYDKLLASKRVIATPHIAGWSQESKVLLVNTLLIKIQAALKKQSAQ
jgi:D-3-phosphoglycerate dehydrogenase